MKKIVGVLLSAALLSGVGGSLAAVQGQNVDALACYQEFAQAQTVATKSQGLEIRAKSAYLMDFGTETAVFSQKEREHLPIASMCKIMTLLLSFEAIERGEMRFDEQLCVSERAASMGGSQVFLEANAKYPVRELLKSIVVCSANDSCVAMAERVAGGESAFVERMNARAKELGANDTLFANCTGLPKEPQYSCAKDVAIMLKALLCHEEYFTFGKVWLDKFSHPKGRYTEITNTNKLVRFYDGCDGGKTGFTNDAGFCLAATAKRGNMRVISVVIGEESSKNRFDDVRSMFDYAFANYTVTPIVEGGVPLDASVEVSGGKIACVAVAPERSAYSFTKRGETPNITLETRFKRVKAPLEKNAAVGELLIFKDGVQIDCVRLLACEEVDKAKLWDRFKEIAKGWNAR